MRRIWPDSHGFARDERHLEQLLRRRIPLAEPDGPAGEGDKDADLESLPAEMSDISPLGHPAIFSAVSEARVQPSRPVWDIAFEAVSKARTSASRMVSIGPEWNVDLPPGEDYLNACVVRAAEHLPDRFRSESRSALQVVDWRDDQVEVIRRSVRALYRAWPEMTAELRTGVKQIVMVGGRGIVGFTDFAAHGAIFVGERRLREADGLPVHLRLAESLVHEGTHTRCNSAAVAEPFFTGQGSQNPDTLVETPLRADPRPISGLFQQLVVLVRCGVLYERLVGQCDADTADRCRMEARTLFGQASDAARTLRAHESLLSMSGREIVYDAVRILEGSGVSCS
ncbi:aKG-HExxH-type peptide beta-hydroxylase [Nonomuraea sp. NPDC003201]